MSVAHALDEHDDQRLDFILQAQEHCDHSLTPIADPGGKSVLAPGPHP